MKGNTEINEVNLGDFIKILAAQKKMTQTEVALASGRSQGRLSNIIKQYNVTIKILGEILQCVKEDLVVVLKNGHKYKLVEK